MKRRFFLAGLIAAPVAVAAAPALAEQPVHRGLPTGSGFTADQLRYVSDWTVEHYAKRHRATSKYADDDLLAYYNPMDGADEI